MSLAEPECIAHCYHHHETRLPSSMRLTLQHKQCLSYLSILRQAYPNPSAAPGKCTGLPSPASSSKSLCQATSSSFLDKPAEKRPYSSAPALPELYLEEAESLVSTTASDLRDKVVIGIDPDNNGAVAVLRLQSDDSGGLLRRMSKAQVNIYDMPLEEVQLQKRVRRQADCTEAVNIIRGIVEEHQESADIHAVLEQPIPNPINGSLSFLVTGVGFGVWKGVLASHEIELKTTSARRWKGDLGLNKIGKSGSIILATHLFPQAARLLMRKKDHGRAEALLIAAWALGLRALKIASDDATQGGANSAESKGQTSHSLLRSQDGLSADPLVHDGILSSSVMVSDSVQRHYVATEGCIKLNRAGSLLARAQRNQPGSLQSSH